MRQKHRCLIAKQTAQPFSSWQLLMFFGHIAYREFVRRNLRRECITFTRTKHGRESLSVERDFDMESMWLVLYKREVTKNKAIVAENTQTVAITVSDFTETGCLRLFNFFDFFPALFLFFFLSSNLFQSANENRFNKAKTSNKITLQERRENVETKFHYRIYRTSVTSGVLLMARVK